MNKDYLGKIVFFTNIMSVIVVMMSVAAITFAAIKIFNKTDNVAETRVKVEYRLQIDTIAVKHLKDSTSIYYLKTITDNNKKIYNQIDRLLRNYQERQSEIINESKNQSDFVSYASAIFALILSVAGFFGFKSINEMKKEAIELATEDAKKAAIEEAKKSFNEIQKIHDESLNVKIQKITQEGIQSATARLTDEISALREELDRNNKAAEEPGEQAAVAPSKNNPFNDEQL